MSDERAKQLSEAALRCRERRIHPTVDLIDALYGKHGGKARVSLDHGATRVERTCLTEGCGVLIVDVYGVRGVKIKHDLIYPKDENGKSLYLLPPGGGYMHPDDVRAEIWARYAARKTGQKARRK